MKRITREQAIEKVMEFEKSALEKLSKEDLMEICLARMARYAELSSDAELNNRMLAITNGEYGVIRKDVGDES